MKFISFISLVLFVMFSLDASDNDFYTSIPAEYHGEYVIVSHKISPASEVVQATKENPIGNIRINETTFSLILHKSNPAHYGVREFYPSRDGGFSILVVAQDENNNLYYRMMWMPRENGSKWLFVQNITMDTLGNVVEETAVALERMNPAE